MLGQFRFEHSRGHYFCKKRGLAALKRRGRKQKKSCVIEREFKLVGCFKLFSCAAQTGKYGLYQMPYECFFVT